MTETRWVMGLLVTGFACLLVFGATNALADARQEPGDQNSEPATKVERAEQPAATIPARKPYDPWTAKKLTGDWGGLRTDLEDAGISFALRSTTQLMTNMYGGLETKNGHDSAACYDLKIYLDLGKMNLIPGGEIYFQAKGTSGGDSSDFDKEKIGALFKTNQDAKTEEPIYVDKWWWKQRLLDDRVKFVLGQIGTDKDFIDVNMVAGSEDKQFMNTALVRNPTIPHKTALGAFVNVWATDWLYICAAAMDPEARDRRTGFDTAFHGEDRIRLFAEIGLAPKFESANGKLAGHYRFGSWYRPHPQSIFRDDLGGLLAPRSRSGDVGYYFGCDQMVWKENDDPKDKQGASVFARYGFARGDVNKIEHFWSCGAQYVGLISGRDKDTLGLGIAQAILSNQYHDEIHDRADRETVYELYYSIQATPWCVISPDLQFIANAGGDKGDRNAFVAGLRLRVEL